MIRYAMAALDEIGLLLQDSEIIFCVENHTSFFELA